VLRARAKRCDVECIEVHGDLRVPELPDIEVESRLADT